MIAICCVVVLGACGEGSAAQTTTSAAAPSTPTDAPTREPSPDPLPTDRAGEPLVPPERPTAMESNDERGAQAAAEYFVELYGYTLRTQDTEKFEQICDSESLFCNEVISEVKLDVESGNYTLGGSARQIGRAHV